MPRYDVQYKTICTWATDVEADSLEEARKKVTPPNLVHDCELVEEEDYGPITVTEQEEDSDA